MDQTEAHHFAAEWENYWNRQDIDGLLQHFADDVWWTSPVAAQMVPGSHGEIRGKEALRAYFSSARSEGLELHFEVVAVYCGVTSMVVNYRNQRGTLVNEVLLFNQDGLVREGHATYPVAGRSDQGLPGTD